MILYHGSDIIVAHPDTLHSKEHLDFGVGFYTTSIQSQAGRWAKRKAALNGKTTGFVSMYEANDMSGFAVQNFGDNLDAWLDFVCSCRDGSDIYRKYDVILGKVADDKVFRVVDMYKRGVWDKERAIKEIHVYETYDQIAYISQKAIDAILVFRGSYEVKL